MAITTRAAVPRAILVGVCGLSAAASGQGPCEGGPVLEYPYFEGSIRAIRAWDPDGQGPEPEWLVLAGSFYLLVNGEFLDSVVAWNGRAFRGFSLGLSGAVETLAVYNGELIAGGEFYQTGREDPVRYIARWDGAEWRPMGGGMDMQVRSLAIYQGELVACGDFWEAGGQPANHIARWNGAEWRPFASELEWRGDPSWGLIVRHVCVFRGELIVAGRFSHAGDVPANHIARWDGLTWRSLGAGVNSQILSMTVHNDQVIIGGYFTNAGGVPANYVARWDGQAWHAMGEGVNYWVSNLGSSYGNLLTERLDRWTGAGWVRFDPGFRGIALGFAEYNGETVVGGSDDRDRNAFRRYSPHGIPWIAVQPRPTTVECGAAAEISALAALGYDPLIFTWERADAAMPGGWRSLEDGPLVVDDVVVGSVSNATTESIRITPTVGVGPLTLRCRISHPCGSVESEPAELVVVQCPQCKPDVNCDGAADQHDVECLVLAVSGDGSCFCQTDLDFNGDGVPDQGDVVSLLAVLAGDDCR